MNGTADAIDVPSPEVIAEICHEANRFWCVACGDVSQKPWLEAAEWQRDSAIKGVQFALANPSAGDSAQHDAWCVDKRAAGWKYGAVKDETAKTHPCLVSFVQLPPHQRAKDRLFRAIVLALGGL